MLVHASGDSVQALSSPRAALTRRRFLAAGLAGLPLLGMRLLESAPQVSLDWVAAHRPLADALIRARDWAKPLLVYADYVQEDIADLWLSGDVQAQLVMSLCESCRTDLQAVSALFGRPSELISAPMVLIETTGSTLRFRPLQSEFYRPPYRPTDGLYDPCGVKRGTAEFQAKVRRHNQEEMRHHLRALRGATPQRDSTMQLTATLAHALAPNLSALEDRAEACAARMPSAERERITDDLWAGNSVWSRARQAAPIIALTAVTTAVPRKRRRLCQTLAAAGDVTHQKEALCRLFCEKDSASPEVLSLLHDPRDEDDEL